MASEKPTRRNLRKTNKGKGIVKKFKRIVGGPLTPGEAIKRYCVRCCGGQGKAVESCDGDSSARKRGFRACPFHPFRIGKGRPSVKTIRAFCLECQGQSRSYVRECKKTDCLCYPFRLGANPNYRERPSSIRPQKGGQRGGFEVYNQLSPGEMSYPTPFREILPLQFENRR